MAVKLFHVADIHLGRRRLDGRLPHSDLAAAFGFVAEKAIEEKADVFLIAGDLFDRPTVEPPHLRQAQQVLGRLKANGIRTIAIEGNHDREFIHSEVPTWMQFLAEDDLLVLLRTPFDSTGPILSAWDPERRTGSWIELNGVRLPRISLNRFSTLLCSVSVSIRSNLPWTSSRYAFMIGRKSRLVWKNEFENAAKASPA